MAISLSYRRIHPTRPYFNLLLRQTQHNRRSTNQGILKCPFQFCRRKRSRCFSSMRNISSSSNNSSNNSVDTIHPENSISSPLKFDRGDIHLPPLPIRVALVSCTTALSTPVFPAIGFVHLCLRILGRHPSTNNGYQWRWKYPITAYSFGTICNVAFYYVLPISYELSPILLPCAIGNGLVAGTSYWAVDALSRSRLLSSQSTSTSTSTSTSNTLAQMLPSWLKNPLVVGGGIGAWTGLVAPPLLYGPLCKALYGVEGISHVVSNLYWTLPLVPQISCMTGFVAGIFMYPFLYYPIHGIPGVSWKNFSGVILMATGLTMYHVYKGPGGDGEDHRVMVGISEGSFVPKRSVPLLSTIVRYDNQGQRWGSYSLQNQQWVGDPELKEKGDTMAETVRKYQAPGWWWTGGMTRAKYYTFDDPILAFYCEWLDEHLGERYQDHVVHVRPAHELQTVQHNMLQTDWVVKCILQHEQQSNGEERGNDDDSIHSNKSIMQEELRNVTFLNMTSDRQVKNFAESILSASHLIEIIMSMRKQRFKQEGDSSKKQEHIINTSVVIPTNPDMDAIIQEMETMVRKLTPGIVLYQQEETDGVKGQSVESQLNALSWEPPSLEMSIHKWQDIKSRSKSVMVKKVLIGVVSCVALVAVLFTNQ